MQRALHHSGPHCQTKALKDTSGLGTAHTCAGGGVANVGGGAAGGLLGTLCHCRQAGRQAGGYTEGGRQGCSSGDSRGTGARPFGREPAHASQEKHCRCAPKDQ